MKFSEHPKHGKKKTTLSNVYPQVWTLSSPYKHQWACHIFKKSYLFINVTCCISRLNLIYFVCLSVCLVMYLKFRWL